MEEFLKFVSEVLDVEPSDITMQTTYKEYEKWDSLSMLMLVMELEQKYGVSISIDEINNIRTLEDLYKLVSK